MRAAVYVITNKKDVIRFELEYIFKQPFEQPQLSVNISDKPIILHLSTVKGRVKITNFIAMRLTKNQWFGLITFLVLLLASYLVTVEPWKKSSSSLVTNLEVGPPVPIIIRWVNQDVGYPATHTTDTILAYSAFTIGYSEAFEQAAWVAYVLTREEVLSDSVKRNDRFRADTLIISGSAELSDYRGSGYDRGHLAPAADMRWSKRAMDESFLLSNMSPQEPSFNRGIWKRLEEKVRVWALEKDSIYILTGPVLNSVVDVIGANDVGVPDSYFKVLVDLSPPDHDMVAFLLPHEGSSSDPVMYAITVDSLESVTGYDFFARAPDQEMIDWLEGTLLTENWK
jgi:DNA/RNA endonuclease G (NUC1)